MQQAGTGGRLIVLDLARTAALVGMVIFHFTLDLQMFGHLPPGTIGQPGWQVFSWIIAGSFLALAGASLFLAHGQGIHWPKFGRRLAMLVGAAALVTLGTYIAVRPAFIFFGILHSIAAASVIGLLFLRVPAALTLLVAAGIVLTDRWVQLPAFDTPLLYWVGLGTVFPQTMDYEPLFPWLAPFLMGLALAKALAHRGLLQRLQATPPAPHWLHRLAWPGRHSLAIYLCHQPILFGGLWLLAYFRA